MMRKTIADNEFITLWYHSDKKIVHHRINPLRHDFDAAYRKLFRETLLMGIELLKKNSSHKWLSDDRNLCSLPAEDVEWGQNVWSPRAVIAGWHYWAYVVPKDSVAQVSSSNIIQKLSEMGVITEVFDSPEEATRWLDTK